MKKKRRITAISTLGLIVICMTVMTGCDMLPAIEDTVSGVHISQEEKEKALTNKENWNNNRIDYVPTPSPDPIPTPTHIPTTKTATVSCADKIYPSSVKKSESFNICGFISTNIGTIDKVTGYFIAKDGSVVTKVSDKPKSSTYEIKRSVVDKKLAFKDLELGEYTCVIKAKGSDFDEVEVMSFDFTISTKTVIATAINPTATPTNAPTKVSENIPTSKPEPTKVSIKTLTKEEQEIADKVISAAYPKNCKITVGYKKSNDSGYEHYKITSKYNEKSVSIMQEYEDDSSEIEAVDSYITTIGSVIKKYVYIEGYGWRHEIVNKSYLIPVGNKTAVSINLSEYLDNTTEGQWSVEATSSEYIVSGTGIKNKTNNSISKDVTIITDKNYEIKSVDIKTTDTAGIFRYETGYTIDINIAVSDKSKMKVTIPEEVTSDIFDFEQYVVDIVKKTLSKEDVTVNRDVSGKLISFSYYDSVKKRTITTTFNDAITQYGLEKYK